MKKALIERATKRLCQVEPVNPDPESGGVPFPVHTSLEWRDCADDVKQQTHEFDGEDFFLKPSPRALTVDELEAQAVAALNGGGDFDPRKLFKAKMISDLAFRLGKAPGALTAAELLAERNRIAAIYKAL